MPDFTVTKPGKRQRTGPANNETNNFKKSKIGTYTVPIKNKYEVQQDHERGRPLHVN